jgi:hypothetical protein
MADKIMNDWMRFRDVLDNVVFPDLDDIERTIGDIFDAAAQRGSPDPYGDALRIIVGQLENIAELLRGAKDRFYLLVDHTTDQDNADQGLLP